MLLICFNHYRDPLFDLSRLVFDGAEGGRVSSLGDMGGAWSRRPQETRVASASADVQESQSSDEESPVPEDDTEHNEKKEEEVPREDRRRLRGTVDKELERRLPEFKPAIEALLEKPTEALRDFVRSHSVFKVGRDKASAWNLEFCEKVLNKKDLKPQDAHCAIYALQHVLNERMKKTYNGAEYPFQQGKTINVHTRMDGYMGGYTVSVLKGFLNAPPLLFTLLKDDKQDRMEKYDEAMDYLEKVFKKPEAEIVAETVSQSETETAVPEVLESIPVESPDELGEAGDDLAKYPFKGRNLKLIKREIERYYQNGHYTNYRNLVSKRKAEEKAFNGFNYLRDYSTRKVKALYAQYEEALQKYSSAVGSEATLTIGTHIQQEILPQLESALISQEKYVHERIDYWSLPGRLREKGSSDLLKDLPRYFRGGTILRIGEPTHFDEVLNILKVRDRAFGTFEDLRHQCTSEEDLIQLQNKFDLPIARDESEKEARNQRILEIVNSIIWLSNEALYKQEEKKGFLPPE